MAPGGVHSPTDTPGLADNFAPWDRPMQTGVPVPASQTRGPDANAATPSGGSPTVSTRRDNLRRPLILSAGRVPRVPISVGAIPILINAEANGEWVSGACGSRPSR